MSYYPNALKKNKKKKKKNEGDIVIASVRPFVRPSVLLSPPKPLGEIQPNLICELLTCMGMQKSVGPAPWGPAEGQKV